MDIQVENFALNTSNDQSSGIWKITRAMKAAGWRYSGSSDGTTKDATFNPNNDKWGPGVQVGAQTATVAFTIGTPTTTSYGGRSTITGLTGFATTSPGHFLQITGATNAANVGTWLITKYISATSVEIENPAAVAETTPGTATWTELSALGDTFPALGAGAWWCGQGPSTMKVPIDTSVPAGTFQRGENVTQTTSGATGELMGVVTYSGGGGYLVIAPRKSGTGGGPRGWGTGVITGDITGATVTPTATVIEFIREIVFWRSSTTAGHIYCQVIDQAAEGTSSPSGTGRFSTMASLGTCTATVCPGGATGNNPATNGFPSFGTYVASGQGGSGAVGTGAISWVNSTALVNTGLSQILCANCIEDVSVSQDGTITWAAGTFASTTLNTTFAGWGFLRVDDQEDGDVDPYVWYMYPALAAFGRTRVLAANANTSGDVFRVGLILVKSASGTPFLGWRRRGYQQNGVLNGDSWLEMNAFLVGIAGAVSPTVFAITLPTVPETVACSIASVKPRDPIWIVSVGVLNGVSQKMRKGTLRWWYVANIATGATTVNTYDGLRWIQVSALATASVEAPVIVGPGDAATTPTNH